MTLAGSGHPRATPPDKGLNRGQAVAQHRREDVDHLAVSVGHVSKLAADPLQRGGQNPVPEWRPIPQCAGLASQTFDEGAEARTP